MISRLLLFFVSFIYSLKKMWLQLGFLIVCYITGIVTDTYKKGGVAVLSPGSVSGPITSITWKHGPDFAVDWYRDGITAYRDFNGRCELDTNTGALTISNLSLKDSGSYTPEINSKIMSTVKITVITAVPKPTISTHCNTEETQCALTCEASIKDMGPVTYTWKIGDRQRAPSSNQLNITKDDAEFVDKSISCNLTNPVSSERSDIIMSPFTNGSSGAVTIAAVTVSIVLVLVVLGFLVHFIIWLKRRKEGESADCHEYCAQCNLRSCLNCGWTKQWTPEQTEVPKAETETLIPENISEAVIKYSEFNDAQTQDQNPGPSLNGNEAGGAPSAHAQSNGVVTFSVDNETHNQIQRHGPPDTKNETHGPMVDSEDKETSDPKKESAGKLENGNESIQLAAPTSEVQEELNQDQTPPGSADTSSDSAVKQEEEEEKATEDQSILPAV